MPQGEKRHPPEQSFPLLPTKGQAKRYDKIKVIESVNVSNMIKTQLNVK